MKRDVIGKEDDMGWSIGYDPAWKRDIGYGVPAYCDYPDCDQDIDRGLSYVCGGEPYGGDCGCGLYFCDGHLGYAYTPGGLGNLKDDNGDDLPQMCKSCIAMHESPDSPPQMFDPKPEHPEWIAWKLNDSSWAQWRSEHPDEVQALRAS
jgi:hypothetical protein